jgi:hypothetical protein
MRAAFTLVEADKKEIVSGGCVQHKPQNSQKLRMIEYMSGSSDYRVSPQQPSVYAGYGDFSGPTN